MFGFKGFPLSSPLAPGCLESWVSHQPQFQTPAFHAEEVKRLDLCRGGLKEKGHCNPSSLPNYWLQEEVEKNNTNHPKETKLLKFTWANWWLSLRIIFYCFQLANSKIWCCNSVCVYCIFIWFTG